jgi:alpha-glucosidase
MPSSPTDPDDWWRHGVVYQVYPRSYQDSNGDGIGDLAGIRQRLGYLEWLGVDALWISPIYPSPMADFGYDVSDYCDVDPRFGTLGDFDALVDDAHRRGLRVILDFVPNHTSDQHPWFRESRRSRDSDLRDFYLWREGSPGGGPPNNWLSQFGGRAWSYDTATSQWYYHAFLPQQPDLNWRDPRVRARMYDVLRFWLRRGADGFRVDVIWHLAKDPAFRDNPPNPDWSAQQPEAQALLPIHTTDLPEVMEIIAEMRAVLGEFDRPSASRILIGEIYLPIERLVAYYAPDEAGALRGVQLPFNFHLVFARWQAQALAALIARYEGALPRGAWPNWVLGNHDQSRIASRVGEPRARLAMLLLLTLRGTPTLYYGDELALADTPIPPESERDPAGLREPGKGRGRDPQRTPMPWESDGSAGFTTGAPWLPLNADHRTRNVARQREDPDSMLVLTRALLALRRAEPALHQGSLDALEARGECLRFERRHGARRLCVELNFGDEPVPSRAAGDGARVLLAVCRVGGKPAASAPTDIPALGGRITVLGPAAPVSD